MAGLQSLLKDTALYGISSIVGRFLNYLLVPVYAAAMSVASGGYGVVTEVYAWTALLLVLLTYGMETTFFRFVNKESESPDKVYSTVLIMVGSTSLMFASACMAFLQPIAAIMGYASHPWYVGMMLLVVSMDAFQSIVFSYLRYRKRPVKFVALKLLFIVLNLALNLLYYFFLGGTDVFYAFLFNLICTSFIMLLLLPELHFKTGFDVALARRMLHYAYPILILGVAGILNQVADKIMFRYVYPNPAAAQSQLAVYSACSKIAMIMAMLTQAFRYAYEPFVFGESRNKDNKVMYAKAMKYFIIFTLLAFLVVMSYLDILKHILHPDYWVGLKVIPVVMAAEIFMGVFFNLSFWYKLIDETRWGAYFSLVGCAVLVLVNLLFIPHYGYMACAWGGFAGYGVAMLLSYWVGQKKYPIAYDLRGIACYVLFALVLYALIEYIYISNLWIRLAFRSCLLLLFVAYVVRTDLPLNQIPVINRIIKKK